MLAALSIQLSLYAATWFLMGRAFGLDRKAVLAWAAAWAMLAVVTLLLVDPRWTEESGLRLVLNLVLVSAFVALMWGSTKAAEIPIRAIHVWAPILGASLVDMFRYLWLEETTAIRWVGFSVFVTWPILVMVARLTVSLRRLGYFGITVLVWVPAAIVVTFFALRAFWMADSTPSTQPIFGDKNQADQVAIAMFLVSLGAINFAQAAFVIGRLVQKLHILSSTDQLTHLANRRTLIRQLEKEDARYRRNGRKYAIAILDLDHFKRINDTYGHLAGDQVLRVVSSALTSDVRGIDVVSRYGGEEFLVLMPEIEVDAVQSVGERIRMHISELVVPFQSTSISVTVSVGLAVPNEGDDTYESVIKRADDSLYAAKAAGRNRVIFDANQI